MSSAVAGSGVNPSAVIFPPKGSPVPKEGVVGETKSPKVDEVDQVLDSLAADNRDDTLKARRWEEKFASDEETSAKHRTWTTRLKRGVIVCSQSNILLSLAVFALTFVLLLMIRPPFVLKRTEHSFEKPRVSFLRVLIWSLLTAILVFLIPLAFQYFSKKK